MVLACTALAATLFTVINPAGAAVPHGVGALSVSVYLPTASAQDATYSVSFVATSGITTSGPELTIVTPNGTGTPVGATFTDNTNPGSPIPTYASARAVPPTYGTWDVEAFQLIPETPSPSPSAVLPTHQYQTVTHYPSLPIVIHPRRLRTAS